MFHAGRFIAGLGIGILVTVCPMYLSELAPPSNRGWLVGHHAIFLVFGYVLASWLGFACYFATDKNPSFAWRFPLSMQCFGPLVLLFTSVFIPRSPRWLLQKGKVEEAWGVLLRLRKTPSDVDDLVAREELYQTRKQLALDQSKLQTLGYGPWMAILKKKSYRKRIIIGFLTQWGAEFAGPLVIVSCSLTASFPSLKADSITRTTTLSYYIRIWDRLATCLFFFRHCGSPLQVSRPLNSFRTLKFQTQLTTMLGFIYNPFGAWLHDRVNSRRWMFMVGLMGCLVTTSGLAGCVARYAGTTNKAGNAAGVFFIFLYLAFQGSVFSSYLIKMELIMLLL